MNLRKKNKKLKRELESARRQLEFNKIFIDQARSTVREAKEFINRNVGDVATLQVYAHSPKYAMTSEEEFKRLVIQQMIPELSTCVTLERYTTARVGVLNDDYVLAKLRVVKPRE